MSVVTQINSYGYEEEVYPPEYECYYCESKYEIKERV